METNLCSLLIDTYLQKTTLKLAAKVVRTAVFVHSSSIVAREALKVRDLSLGCPSPRLLLIFVIPSLTKKNTVSVRVRDGKNGLMMGGRCTKNRAILWHRKGKIGFQKIRTNRNQSIARPSVHRSKYLLIIKNTQKN